MLISAFQINRAYQTSKTFKKLIKKKRDLNFSMQGDKDGLLDKIASHPFAFP